MQSGSTVYIYSEGGIRSFLSTDRQSLHGLHTVNVKRVFIVEFKVLYTTQEWRDIHSSSYYFRFNANR